MVDNPFDMDAYRHQVEIERKRRGFRSVESFVYFIYSRTRFKVSVDSYYKWMRDEYKNRFDYVLAINLALYGTFMPPSLMERCIDPAWMEIEGDGGKLPREWRIENYIEAVTDLDFGSADPTPAVVAERLHGNPDDYLDPNGPEDAKN